MKKRHLLVIFLSVSLLPFAFAQTVILSDDFDADTSANYTQVNGTDVQVDFAWDYSAATIEAGSNIPVAPNTSDSSKKGLRMEVNLTAGARTGINVYTNEIFSDDYMVDVDVFFRVGTATTTEYYRMGINHTGTQLVNSYQGGTANTPVETDGYYYQGTGDGGASIDYMFRRGDSAAADDNADGGVFEVSGNVGGSNGNGTDPFDGTTVGYYATTNYPGCTGDQWLELRITYISKVVRVYMDGNLIATLSDPAQRWTSGKVSLGMEDTFTSVATAGTNYVIFDNLRVTQILPGTAVDSSWLLYE